MKAFQELMLGTIHSVDPTIDGEKMLTDGVVIDSDDAIRIIEKFVENCYGVHVLKDSSGILIPSMVNLPACVG